MCVCVCVFFFRHSRVLQGHPLSAAETDELLAVTGVIHYLRAARDASVSGQVAGFVFPEQMPLVLQAGKEHSPVHVTVQAGAHTEDGTRTFSVQLGNTSVIVRTAWRAENPLVPVSVSTADGTTHESVLQLVNKTHTGYRIQFLGTQVRCRRDERERGSVWCKCVLLHHHTH